MKGKFIIIDGPDGSGKTNVMYGLAAHLRKQGKKVFDLKDYWRHSRSLPEPEDLYMYDVILSAEPTFSLVGGAIRDELIRTNKRHYSTLAIATAFSLDRLILYKRIIIPLLEKGKTVIQDRGFTTSIVYQPILYPPIQSETLPLKKVMDLEGNQLALKHRPDLLLILDVSPEKCVERIAKRPKKDYTVFEEIKIQKTAHNRFMSKWFRDMFLKKGSKVAYLDAGKSRQVAINQAIRIYENLVKK